jgi:hypothetical protein
MHYYHGSGEVFSEFNKNKIGLNYLESEGGFFFTQKKQTAENYALLSSISNDAGYVYEVEVSLVNPLVIVLTKEFCEYYKPADYFDMNRWGLLHETGIKENDGIIIKGVKADDLCVAFEPEQIEILKITKNNIEVALNKSVSQKGDFIDIPEVDNHPTLKM